MNELIPVGLAIAVPFGALAIAAGVRHVRRIRALRDRGPRLTDEMIRQLEDEGWVDVEDEEPLDREAIREAEERFWDEERWDGADTW
ncbi:MAG: hypothetical protein ACRELV_05545 [Longimicrobiales bacterium]